MNEFSILVAGGASVRLPTAGKYCDRDIVVTSEEGGVELPELSSPGSSVDLMAGKQLIDGEGKVVDGTFAISEELTEQDSLIEQIKNALQGKAAGGSGGVGNLTKYAKIIATPQTTTSFVINNPLGGIAKKVSLQATSEPKSTVTARKYVADYDLGIGAMWLASSSEDRRYATIMVDGTPGNQQFSISEGVVILNRINSANVWDNTAEYEVEIYE